METGKFLLTKLSNKVILILYFIAEQLLSLSISILCFSAKLNHLKCVYKIEELSDYQGMDIKIRHIEEKDSNEVKLGDTVYGTGKVGKVTKIGEHDYITIIGEKETKKKEKEVWIETEDGYQCLLVKCLKPIEKGVWDYDRRVS